MGKYSFVLSCYPQTRKTRREESKKACVSPSASREVVREASTTRAGSLIDGLLFGGGDRQPHRERCVCVIE